MENMEAIMAATRELMAQWQGLHPEVEISHGNVKNLTREILDERLAFINNGLKELGFIQ